MEVDGYVLVCMSTGIRDTYICTCMYGTSYGHGHRSGSGLVWSEPSAGKRLESSSLYSSEIRYIIFLVLQIQLCLVTLCIMYMYSSTCTNSNRSNLLIRIENPLPHALSHNWCKMSLFKQQTMYPIPPKLSNHRGIIVFPWWLAAGSMIRRGRVLADEYLLRAIMPQTNGFENFLQIHLHVRRPNTTFVACQFMENRTVTAFNNEQ